jgi:hypothetical protein
MNKMNNMNFLVSCFGESLKGFFEFCEEQNNGVKAEELNALFNQYFEINDADTAPVEVVKPKKAPAEKVAPKKTTKEHDLSDNDDDDVSSSSKKKPAKKPAKETVKEPAKARKPSSKGKHVKPRDEQTPVDDLNLEKKKLPELKEYARERGLPVSGTKAQLIENILNYEKEQDPAEQDPANNHSVYEDVVDEDVDKDLVIKKPKTKSKKTCELDDKPKYIIEDKHGLRMIHHNKLDGWFVLNDKDVVVGWVCSDDEIDAEDDESVNMGLDFDPPENLDA